MKRPMVLCGAAAICLSLLMIRAVENFVWLSVVVFVVLAAMLLLFKRFSHIIPLLLVSIIILLISVRCVKETENIKMAKALDKDETIKGVVTDVNYNENSVSYIIKTGKIKINLISTKGVRTKLGDKIGADIRVISAGEYADLSRGAHAAAYLMKLKSLEKTNSLYSRLDTMRKDIKNLFFESGGGDEAAMLIGLTLGEKGYISDTLSDNIRRSGVSHMIVVSGLHLGIIVGAFLNIARRVKINRILTGTIGILMVLFIIALTGFTVSVMRSALAYLILLFGYILGRKPDATNSLFAAVLILCLVNPLVVTSVSFQLSVSATFGVLVVAPAINAVIMKNKGEKWYDKIAAILSSVVSTSFAATLMTLPFTLWHFGVLSTVSILTNLLTNHLVTVVLILAVLGVAVCFISPLCELILLLARVAVKLQIYFINSLGSLPFAEYSASSPKILATITFCIAAGFAYFIKKTEKGVTKNGGSF